MTIVVVEVVYVVYTVATAIMYGSVCILRDFISDR
jgi:hypothetical protein